MRAGLVLLTLVLSGCVNTLHAGPASLPHSGVGAFQPHRFLSKCPGSTGNAANATCASTISLPDVGLEEPNLAVDKVHPLRLALVTNAQGAQANGSNAIPPVLHLELFSSNDGGRTWQRQSLPDVDAPTLAGPLRATIVYDGSLGYAPSGTLYLAGIASNNGGGGGCLPNAITWPFETHSRDNGQTWSAPHVFERVASDRTWLTVADDQTVYVNWFLPCQNSSQAARSSDGGETWETANLPCQLVTPFASDIAGVRAGCGNKTLSWNTIGVLKEQSPEPVPGIAWRIARAPDGHWALFTADFNKRKLYLAWSDATLSNWSSPLDLLATSSATAAWQTNRLFAAGVDGNGVAHAILVGGPYPQECDPSGGIVYRETPGGCDVVHLAVAENSANVLDTRLLSSGEPTNRTPPAPTIGVAASATGDDYAGIGFGLDETYLAWAREGSIQVTELVPS